MNRSQRLTFSDWFRSWRDCPLCPQGSPTQIQATNWNDRDGAPIHVTENRWCSFDGLPRKR